MYPSECCNVFIAFGTIWCVSNWPALASTEFVSRCDVLLLQGFDWAVLVVFEGMIMNGLAHAAIFLIGYFQCSCIAAEEDVERR